MTRLHAPALEALAKKDGERWIVTSPAPGWFFPSPWGTVVTRGREVGALEILGRRMLIIAPDVAGVIGNSSELGAARMVAFGDPLVVLESAASSAGLAATRAGSADQAASATGLVFRAPTSGRFYGRPSPDKAPFVTVGDELALGATICLLEVMKTFNRVTYGGSGLPERAKVREILVAEGADVTAGEPLLTLE